MSILFSCSLVGSAGTWSLLFFWAIVHYLLDGRQARMYLDSIGSNDGAHDKGDVTMPAANGRLTDLDSVVGWCLDNGIEADVVGVWVWASFESKPTASIRESLKAVGFRWSTRRSAWAHNCGTPSKRGRVDPRRTYGMVPVSAYASRDDD